MAAASAACSNSSLILGSDGHRADGSPEAAAEAGPLSADAMDVGSTAPALDGGPTNVSDGDAAPGALPCGVMEHVCCSSDAGSSACAAGLVCLPNNSCQKCGGTGDPCCLSPSNPAGPASVCFDPKATCVASLAMPVPTCAACGLNGGICCAGKTCTEAGTACLFMSQVGYRCGKCGGVGEPACP